MFTSKVQDAIENGGDYRKVMENAVNYYADGIGEIWSDTEDDDIPFLWVALHQFMTSIEGEMSESALDFARNLEKSVTMYTIVIPEAEDEED